MSRNQRRGGIGLLLLASQIMQISTDRIPPVTLFTVILNAAIYMRLWPGLPSVGSACSSNKYVFDGRQWKRLFLSSFYHLDDMHLYYNMISFIWKGMTLERKLGKRKFIILLAVFSIATQVVMLGLNAFFAKVFLNKYYLRTCAAGFSAVIFALKVLTTASSDGNESIMGLPVTVPSRYACWVELIVIQMLVPNASFTGHLAGILVGLMYIYGPLKWIVKALSKLTKGEFFPLPTQPRYNYQRAPTGTRQQQASRNTSQTPTYDEEDEQLQRAIRESLRDHQDINSQPPTYGWNIPSNSHPPSNGDNPPRSNLYPDLNERTRQVPSAPPDPSETASGLPYPPNDEWGSPPYPVDDTILPRPPMNTRTESESEIRRARLRRFDKK